MFKRMEFVLSTLQNNIMEIILWSCLLAEINLKM